jgi:hypothetical protein
MGRDSGSDLNRSTFESFILLSGYGSGPLQKRKRLGERHNMTITDEEVQKQWQKIRQLSLAQLNDGG